MFDILGGIQLINTLFTTAKNVKSTYDVITGVKVKTDKDIDLRLQKLENHIYYSKTLEVKDTSITNQKFYDNPATIAPSLRPLQNVFQENIIFSKPILTPDPLKKVLKSNPRELLYEITELSNNSKQSSHFGDPTMVPVMYSDANKNYIGWMKIGYAKDYLFSFEPVSNLAIPQSKKIIPRRSPLTINSLQYKDSEWLENYEVITDCEVSDMQGMECAIFCYFFTNSNPIEIVFEGDNDPNILCSYCSFNSTSNFETLKFKFSVPRHLVFNRNSPLHAIREKLTVGFRIYQKLKEPILIHESELYYLYGT